MVKEVVLGVSTKNVLGLIKMLSKVYHLEQSINARSVV
jgi:hypothetical protein